MAIFNRKKKESKHTEDQASSPTSNSTGKRNVSSSSRTSAGAPYEKFRAATPPQTSPFPAAGSQNVTNSSNGAQNATPIIAQNAGQNHSQNVSQHQSRNDLQNKSQNGPGLGRNSGTNQTQNANTSTGSINPSKQSTTSQYPWSKHFISNASPFPRYGHAANYIAARDGEVFVMGGLKGSNVFGDLWVIESDTLTGYLLDTEGCPSPRVGHASLTLGNAFIVFGGDTKIEETDELDDNLYLLNTTTLKWTVANPTGPRPSGRYGHSISTIGSKVYIFGGQLDDYFFDDLVCYDLTRLRDPSSKWELITSTTPAPPPRTNHSVVTYQDKLYLFGGTDGRLWYSDTWVFDPADLSWTQLDCSGFLPAPCEGHASTIVGDIMYVFGGRSAQGDDLPTLSALKLGTRKWFTFQNLGPGPSPRAGHSMTAFGGNSILVMGGESVENEEDYDSAKQTAVYVLDTSRITYPIDKPVQQIRNQSPVKVSGTNYSANPAGAAASPVLPVTQTPPNRVSSPFNSQSTNGPARSASPLVPASSSVPPAGTSTSDAIRQPGSRNSQRVASPMSLATGGSPRNQEGGRTQSPLMPQSKAFDGPFTPVSRGATAFPDANSSGPVSHAGAAGAAALAASGVAGAGAIVGTSKKKSSSLAGFGPKFSQITPEDQEPGSQSLGSFLQSGSRESAREQSIINSYGDEEETRSTDYDSADDRSLESSPGYRTNDSLPKEASSTPERKTVNEELKKDSPTTPTLPNHAIVNSDAEIQRVSPVKSAKEPVHSMPGAWHSETVSSQGSVQSRGKQSPTVGTDFSAEKSIQENVAFDDDPIVTGTRNVSAISFENNSASSANDTLAGTPHGINASAKEDEHNAERFLDSTTATPKLDNAKSGFGAASHSTENPKDASTGVVNTGSDSAKVAVGAIAGAVGGLALGATHGNDTDKPDSLNFVSSSHASSIPADVGSSFSGTNSSAGSAIKPIVSIPKTEDNEDKTAHNNNTDSLREAVNTTSQIPSETGNTSDSTAHIPNPEEVKSVEQALERLKASNSWYESELAVAKEQGFVPNNKPPVDVLKLRRVSQRLTQDNANSLSERDILVAALAELKEELQLVQNNVQFQAESASERLVAIEKERDHYKTIAEGAGAAAAAGIGAGVVASRSIQDGHTNGNEPNGAITKAAILTDEQHASLEQRAREQADKLILLEHEKSKLVAELEETQSRNKEVEATAGEHISALAAAGAAVTAAHSHVDELTRQIDSHNDERDALKAENRQLRAQIAELQDKVENSQMQISHHRGLAEQYETSSRQANTALASGIAAISSHWSARNEYYEKNRDGLSAAGSEKSWQDALSGVRREHAAEIDTHKSALNQALEKVESLQTELAENDKKHTQLLSQKSELEKELGQTRTQLDDHSNQLGFHKNQVKELNDKHEALASQLSSQGEAHKADYEAKLRELEDTHNDKYKELEADYEKSMQYFKNQEMALSKTRDELSKYKEQNGKMQSKLDELLLKEKDGIADISSHSVNSDFGASPKINQRHLDLQLRDLRAQVIILQEERDELKTRTLELRKAQINNGSDLEYAQEEAQRLADENRRLEQRLDAVMKRSQESPIDPSSGQTLDSFSSELERLRKDRERQLNE